MKVKKDIIELQYPTPQSGEWEKMCKCGHTRIKHFVGGPISDCDKCECKKFQPKD
jgi:hypothetical protein